MYTNEILSTLSNRDTTIQIFYVTAMSSVESMFVCCDLASNIDEEYIYYIKTKYASLAKAV